MRITVSDVDIPSTDNTRAYAEYRFFRSIAPHEGRVRAVHVVITRGSGPNHRFLCTVHVDLGAAGHIKTQARGTHPSAAIDRAADRTAWLVGRRLGNDFSLKSPDFTS